MDTIDQANTSPKPAPKQGGGKKILRARPLEGDIDHEALSHEFMAKYPKLRAALAK